MTFVSYASETPFPATSEVYTYIKESISMTGHYDSGLVFFSIFIAVIASFVTIDLSSRVAATRGSNAANYWLVGGSISMGMGIWAMHFVGMLAFSLPIAISYDVWITLASLLVAIVASGLALYTLSLDRLEMRWLLISGTLMGIGIASMHYLGMEAMRMRPSIVFDPGLVAISILIAIGASIIALWIAFQLRIENIFSGFGKKCAGALVMGLAISGMHYTGMKAASFAAGSICTTGAAAVDNVTLAGIVSASAMLFLLLSLLVSAYVVMPRTIRGKIALLVVGSMLPVLLLAITVVSYDYHRGKTFLVSSSILSARAAIAEVDKKLITIETSLLTLATSRLLTPDNLGKFNQQAIQAAASLNVDAITLSDADGQMLIDTRQPDLWTTASGENTIKLQRLFEIGKPVIFNLFVPPANGRPQIKVVVPMRQDGKIIYELGAILYASRMQDLLAQRKLPADRIVAIFDSSGTVVARSHEALRFVGEKGAPAVLAFLRRDADEESFENRTRDGILVTSNLSRSPISRWAVGIGIPTDIFVRELWHTIWWMMSALAVLLLCSLGIAWRIGTSINRSIHALIAPALELGSGVHVKIPLLGLFEADEVGTALNQASVLLQQTQHDAQHDGLTGMANRALFNAIVQQQLMIAKRGSQHLAILFIDLDGFKKINDTYGHGTGDGLLKTVGSRIQATIRECDLAARIGGDEFAVLMIQSVKHGPASVAGKLIETLSTPFQIGTLTLEISASIGVAIYPESGDTVVELLRVADEAMYQAKQRGKKNYIVARPELGIRDESNQ
ncbi:MAG: diguanylate cyclase [Pseudomonadota bacterium]